MSPRPGFVLDVDSSTPPTLFWHGERFSLETLPEGSRVIYAPEPMEALSDPQAAIRHAVATQRLRSTAEIGAALRAGTNCGSCLPELQQILAEVIQKLYPKSRIVFTLRDVEKFTIEETAKVLGLSIPAVKTRLLRSRLKLREELTKYFGKDARNAMPTSRR